MPPAQRILPTITYSDPTAGEPPGDVYRLFRGDSSPYTSICTKWRRILSAVVVSEGLWCRFLLPMAYTNAHDASPTPLPLTCKNILLLWRRWLWWVLLPFNCRYIRDSGGYICCYCDEEHHRVEQAYTLIISAPLQKETYDVHYRTPNITTTFNWWTGGGNMIIYNSLEATHSLRSYANIFIRNMFHLNRKEYMICERSRNTYLYVCICLPQPD